MPNATPATLSRGLIPGLVLLLSLSGFSGTASASFISLADIPFETVSQSLVGGLNREFRWTASYDIGFSGATTAFNVLLRINLVGAPAGTSLMTRWESGIETIWSNEYKVAWNRGGLYDLFFDVQFGSANAHHTVNVHAGSGIANMLNWYTVNNSGWSPAFQDEFAAHEAGHMFGNYDEYLGGAVNPNGTFGNRSDNLLGTLSTRQLFDRHFQFAQSWADAHPAIAVPEPTTLLLLLAGLTGTIACHRKSSDRKPPE
jgi:hypothetical protein